ncbi:hypothetical protein DER45DRAFT_543062 [Fusarium avenaceum]|nr:hypothetical protein DER45DRAFT_543062 [Fusarium avenaceum]
MLVVSVKVSGGPASHQSRDSKMVKITTILVASLAAFAPVAEAKDRHCNYYNRIATELMRTYQDYIPNNHINMSLFYCRGGPMGSIEFKKTCHNGCRDGGDGHSDTSGPLCCWLSPVESTEITSGPVVPGELKS